MSCLVELEVRDERQIGTKAVPLSGVGVGDIIVKMVATGVQLDRMARLTLDETGETATYWTSANSAARIGDATSRMLVLDSITADLASEVRAMDLTRFVQPSG